MQNNQGQIVSAIIIAAVIIAGAILLKGTKAPGVAVNPGTGPVEMTGDLAPVNGADRTLGSKSAKVVLVEYADFQCPFCGKFFTEVNQTVVKDYLNAGKIQFVYRDYPFLGQESFKASEAALCAADQGKFWEYHDYLFTHQNGENQGTFADAKLKSFAATLGLNTATFNQCLDSGAHTADVTDSVNKGNAAGVRGTPKGFILKNGKVVSTIDGAEPASMVKGKLDAALK
jgi:protein-disulfide isomerase